MTLLTAGISAPAAALCSGASIEQEFREADLVVRARLVSQTESWNDEPDAAYLRTWGSGGVVTLYRLRASEVFKGRPGARIAFFEEHNSGAFYVDIDKDYLLFLNYYPPDKKRPEAARGATYVRYACGQSKLWDDVAPADLARLRLLMATRGAR